MPDRSVVFPWGLCAILLYACFRLEHRIGELEATPPVVKIEREVVLGPTRKVLGPVRIVEKVVQRCDGAGERTVERIVERGATVQERAASTTISHSEAPAGCGADRPRFVLLGYDQFNRRGSLEIGFTVWDRFVLAAEANYGPEKGSGVEGKVGLKF